MKLNTALKILFSLLMSSNASAEESQFKCLEEFNNDFKQHLNSAENDRLNCLEIGSLCYWDETKTLESGKLQTTRTIVRDIGSYTCTFNPRIQSSISFNTLALLSNSTDLLLRNRSMFRRSGIDCQKVSSPPSRPLIRSYMSRISEMYTNYINKQNSVLQARLAELTNSISDKGQLDTESERLRAVFAASTQPQSFLGRLNNACARDDFTRRQIASKLPRLVGIHQSTFAPLNRGLPGNEIRAELSIH